MYGSKKICKYGTFFPTALPVVVCVVCLLSAIACKTGTKAPDPTATFTKIYEKFDTGAYVPQDILQTSGGYLILGKSGISPYFLRLDDKGDFLYDDECRLENYVAPMTGLVKLKDSYYFTATRREVSPDNFGKLEFYLDLLRIDFDDGAKEFSIFKFPVSFLYSLFDDRQFKRKYISTDVRKRIIRPLHLSAIGDGEMLLLANVGDDGDILLFQLDEQGNSIAAEINYYTDVPCLTTYPPSGSLFHITGSMAGRSAYFFHTYNYFYAGSGQYIPNCNGGGCFGLYIHTGGGEHIFCLGKNVLALEMDDSKAQLNGMYWDGLKMSGAYLEDEILNFFVNSGPSASGVLQNGSPKPELNHLLPVFVQSLEFSASGGMFLNSPEKRKITFFAGSSKSNKIILYAYENDQGTFLGTKKFGDVRYYETCGLIGTADGGLAILGTTYVLDRFTRICLIKLSVDELTEYFDL